MSVSIPPRIALNIVGLDFVSHTLRYPGGSIPAILMVGTQDTDVPTSIQYNISIMTCHEIRGKHPHYSPLHHHHSTTAVGLSCNNAQRDSVKQSTQASQMSV